MTARATSALRPGRFTGMKHLGVGNRPGCKHIHGDAVGREPRAQVRAIPIIAALVAE
jgi:hypothetical protein